MFTQVDTGNGDAEALEVALASSGILTRSRARGSPWALVLAPYLPTRLVDAEVLGNPMHVQEAQDKQHYSHQADDRKHHQGKRGHAVERGGLPMTRAPGLHERRERFGRHASADVTPGLGPCQPGKLLGSDCRVMPCAATRRTRTLCAPAPVSGRTGTSSPESSPHASSDRRRGRGRAPQGGNAGRLAATAGPRRGSAA